jgi:hypothetical protein
MEDDVSDYEENVLQPIENHDNQPLYNNQHSKPRYNVLKGSHGQNAEHEDENWSKS